MKITSAKYIKDRSNSNNTKVINSSKNYKRPHLDIAISTSPNSAEKKKILKLLNFDRLKRVNISAINNQITEPNKNIFSNILIKNLQILSNDKGINKLGKSTLDVKKIFGKINIKKKRETEKEEIKDVPNEKLLSFKNEYILKFAKNYEYFNNLGKNSELISESKKEHFLDFFKKIKRILINQTNIFFDDYKMKNKEENFKFETLDIKSGFYKYKSNQSNKSLELPKIFTTLQNEELSEISTIEKNKLKENKIEEKLNSKNKEIISSWYQLCTLINKFLSLIFNELKESKEYIRQITQKLKDYEVRSEKNNKEIEHMKSFLDKYEVNSKIFLKIKNEKEIEKMKLIFNKKENEYILSNYQLKTEIKNLTSLLEENQKYYNLYKQLEKGKDIDKKKNEELKYFYNLELQEKNMENIIHTENEEELNKKIDELNKVIEGLKSDKDEYKKKDIENKIKIKNLIMNINEKNENIRMQNEEIEWFIREYNKLNNNYLDTKKDLRNIENLLLTKMKGKENNKERNELEKNKEEKSDKNDNKNEKDDEKDNEQSESEKSFLENIFQI